MSIQNPSQLQLIDTSPKPDAGPIPCTCVEHGNYCLLNSNGGDPDTMWPEYHCVIRVIGVVYKRDEDGEIARRVGMKPSESHIKRNGD